MDMNTYQKSAEKTAVYTDPNYPVLGLAEEAGEVCGIVAKAIRDNSGMLTREAIAKLRKELGDVLWMLAMVAAEYGLTLEGIAEANIAKLKDRADRGVIRGAGGDR